MNRQDRPNESNLSREMNAADSEKRERAAQRALALWAAECAEHVLPLFERTCSRNHAPRRAIDAARAWVRGDIRVGAARAAAFAAHAAARSTNDPAAHNAARAAGHAAATAHVASHARAAGTYALKAAASAGVEKARAWQRRRAPRHLRTRAIREPTA